MSIETLITDLIAAVRENTAALAGGVAVTKAAKPAKPAKADTAGTPATDANTAGTPATAASATAGTQLTPATAAPVVSPELMKAIGEAVTKLANGQGRDAVLAVLASFGATKIPDVVAAGKADAFLAAVLAKGNPSAASDFM